MILITGHMGYIGSRLYKRLAPELLSTIGIDRRDDPSMEVEINKIESVDVSEKVDAVYHLAAQAGAMPSWEDPYQDAMDNIMATIRICEMFPDAKLIFTTSGAALDPESPYGLSKKTAEDYIKLLHPNYVILRLSSVYGEKDRGVVDNFIRQDKCTIFGDGSAVRDFVHVDDVVDGLIKAKEWPCGEYSMGSGIGTSIQEIAEATGKPIEYKPAREGEKQEVVLENTTPPDRNNRPIQDWIPHTNVIDYVTEKCKKG